MKRKDLPIGFSFALAQNPDAMKNFGAMPESMQMDILQKARTVSSKAEMRSLVNELSAQNEGYNY
ncbi:MAG: hypothetical protein IJ333_05615 [Clostridia bacterium]|nr:hypothetical protein [Clostridia bacterium]